jgi:acyl carrier protein
MPGERRETILALLAAALEEQGVPPTELRGDVSLRDDLGLDSFQLTRLARQLEEAYDLKFTLVDWILDEEDREDERYTVDSLVTYVQGRL